LAPILIPWGKRDEEDVINEIKQRPRIANKLG